MRHQIVQGIEHLPQLLKQYNSRKLFLVSGSSYRFLSIKEVIDSLGIEQVIFSGFSPNPVYEDVCKGITLLKAEKCDTILAIGGGSAIDVAKCIKLAISAKEGNGAIIPPLVNTRVECDGKRLPFIAIPTTAGSGSESTHNAVMYYEGAKQTITNDAILPEAAILVSSVLKSLPLYQKKCSMMDALCQGIESWWSVNSTEESREFSRQSVELLMQNWRAYIFNNDSEAADNVMLGANYSGRAINITQTTAAHAMSYKMTSLYHLPHGHAVAIGLPEIWQYMLRHPEKCIDARGAEYLADIFLQISAAMGVSTPEQAIASFRQMMVEMNLTNPIAGERDRELQILTSSVNPTRLKNNPVRLDVETIRGLYEAIVP